MFYGGDYNPEQWPEEIWKQDVALMAEAGVNLVTVGVFSWAKLEPQPGHYEFGWMDAVLDLLFDNGVFIDLATATASPPPWLAKLHPESLPVTEDGVTLWPGGRQQYCPSSPAYRNAAQLLVERIADRYGAHPGLVMWHVNNEFGCHVPACYCDTSAGAFKGWLESRYGSIDVLNEAWGTAFWSQAYGDWDEINPPRRAPTFTNPSQELDFKRFSSDALLECYSMERAIVKGATPQIPVTTNFMGFFKPVDYWKWAQHEDVVSDDSYQDPSAPESPMLSAMRWDLMRSLGSGEPWILMEQASNHVNWRRRNIGKRPGQMRAWSYQAVARGANGIMFFQWRASRGGAEKYHSAMVPHVQPESSRVWQEVKQLGNELKQLDEVLETRGQASVAVVFEWDNWWALEAPSKPAWDLRMMDQVFSYYEPLFAANVPVDFVTPTSDLSSYDVVLVPNLYLTRAGVAENFDNFVHAGGALVVSFFSGIVDERDNVYLGGYPAPLRRLLGITFEEFSAMPPDKRYRIALSDSGSCSSDQWSDPIRLEGAEAIATYEEDWLAGRPAVTMNRWGGGRSFYVGTRLDREGMSWLLEEVVGVPRPNWGFEVPSGVEIIRRSGGERVFTFLINHSDREIEVDIGPGRRNPLTESDHPPRLNLEPFEVAVLAT